MRQASAATSSVVVQKASSTANSAVTCRLASDEVSAIATVERKMPSCDSMIQPRLLPQKRPKPGTSYLSSSGAQANLKVGSSATQAKKPTVTMSTPCLASRSSSTALNM